MTDSVDDDQTTSPATQIILAFLEHQTITPADLPQLIREVRLALAEDPASWSGTARLAPARATSLASAPSTPARAEGQIPAVPVDQSIFQDRLISLEDGRPYRTLKRHLKAKYGMSPEDYRRKWGLPPDYPMAAPDYSEARSEVAKRTGLGHTRERRRKS